MSYDRNETARHAGWHGDGDRFYDRVQDMYSRSGGCEPLSDYQIRDMVREHDCYACGRTIHLEDDVSID